MRIVATACGVVGLALLAAVGCGKPSESPNRAPQASAGTSVSPDALPPLDAYLPRLDDRRIEVAPPRGWHIPARRAQFVARFQQSPESDYPAILLAADDAEAGAQLTAENAEQIARQIAAREAVPQAKPRVIGDNRYIEYRKRGVEKEMNRVLDRLILTTLVAGRRYRLELLTREGSLAESRPYLLAVAGGIRYHDQALHTPDAGAAAQPAAATTGEERPASSEPKTARKPAAAPAATKPEAKAPPQPEATAEPARPAAPPQAETAAPPATASEAPKAPPSDAKKSTDDVLKDLEDLLK